MELAASAARGLTADSDAPRLRFQGCVATALAGAALAALITASGPATHLGLAAATRAIVVGVPLGVGLYWWSYRHRDRFGLLLAALGAALLVTTLAETDDELLYSVGRVAGWGVEVLLFYVILSFPNGRLPATVDRILVGIAGAAVVTLFLPRLFLADEFAVPSPYTSCSTDCPGNALFLMDQEPAFEELLRSAGTVAIVAVSIAVLWRVYQRLHGASSLSRRVLVPVLAVGTARVGLLAAGLFLRDIDRSAWPVEVVSWLLAFCAPALAVAFLVGTLHWRLFSGGALEALAKGLQTGRDAPELERALAKAFDDPSIWIALRTGPDPDGWVDAHGRRASLPAAGGGQHVTEVYESGAVVAAIVHDEALSADSRLMTAGAILAGVALDNRRLAIEADLARREKRRSNARLAARAERERRRIERDLHDGAQQSLVALRIELDLAEDLVRSDPERAVARLRELGRNVDDTLEEVRALAHGVYPPLLADKGLSEALRAVATRSTIPVEVELRDLGRFPPELESAVYFCVLEALQNVLKHADGAHRVVVRAEGNVTDGIRFSVRDDGAGAPDGMITPGVGLTNMRDRMAAIDGELEVTSRRGVGTTVSGHVPASAAEQLV